MQTETLTACGFAVRLATATLLVALTYNPSGHSYIHWLGTSLPSVSPLQAIAGLLLLGGWGFFVHATWVSLGTVGVLFSALLAAAVIWLLTSWGWFSLKDTGVVSWLALAFLAVLLAVGLCWSQFRRRVTGQTDVEEVERR